MNKVIQLYLWQIPDFGILDLPDMATGWRKPTYQHQATRNVPQDQLFQHDDYNRRIIRDEDTWGDKCWKYLEQVTAHPKAAMDLLKSKKIGQLLKAAGDTCEIILVGSTPILTHEAPDICEAAILAPPRSIVSASGPTIIASLRTKMRFAPISYSLPFMVFPADSPWVPC
ncbi:hypothetical protein EJ08DRAFT_644583 [Tothia fuscella]|uniref:Uncharacterized protein n=1 Tax=Tothia fuscella TaxID=1048955 RepID=A0A9P4P5U3_9PEZI|nr:hypothetical protein EJ08DRAFT_644583 [Tothia fuscella]